MNSEKIRSHFKEAINTFSELRPMDISNLGIEAVAQLAEIAEATRANNALVAEQLKMQLAILNTNGDLLELHRQQFDRSVDARAQAKFAVDLQKEIQEIVDAPPAAASGPISIAREKK